ncbi:MAG: LysM peptidoglycan-binding domain-containing protein [Flavobacteriales bacterium]
MARQEEIWTKMEAQWLCKALQQSNVPHFDCAAQRAPIVLPQHDSLPLFGKNYMLSKEEKNQFASVLKPDGSCIRLLVMASLCDLYFPLFKKKAEASSLHRDVIYLPMLLSGCNTTYRSDDDKSGLWAMDYLNARRFHLRIDTLVDERHGADFTTDAAMKHYVQLAILFDNDYEKMIVATRMGVPYVHRIEEHLDGRSFFESLDVDSQTFIKLLAYVKAIIEGMRTENQLQPYFDIMALQEPIVFTDTVRYRALAAVLQTEESLLHLWNPVYTGTFIESSYRKIPFMMDKALAARYEIMKDSILRWQPPVPPKAAAAEAMEEKIVWHKVKRGETLGSIAAKHHTTVKKLKKWNKLKGDRLHIGQKLKIYKDLPASKAIGQPETKVIESVKEQPSDAEKSGATKSKNDTKSLKLKEAKKEKTTTYVVKSGDSLWKIAKRYKGVTPEDIMQWNKCGENLKPGQKLVIHTK